MKASSIITTVLLCILAALFALWAFGAEYSLLAMLCAAVAAGLFGLCIIRWIPALWGYCTSPAEPLPSPGYRASRFDRRHPWARIALMVLLLHAAMYILAYAIALTRYGYSGGVLDTLRGLWLRSDSPSYLGIAQNWYVTEGDPRFHIVFFPLYPILIRIFMLLTGDAFWAAMLVSTLCAIGSVIMAYELAALDMPRSAALYAALLLCLLPGNIFLAAPMTEALFLLPTENPELLLGTVRSRCELITLPPIDRQEPSPAADAVFDAMLEGFSAAGTLTDAPNLGEKAVWCEEQLNLLVYAEGVTLDIRVEYATARPNDSLLAARHLAALLIGKM